MPKINNEHTKMQIKNWLENAVKMAQNPDPREKMKRIRKERSKKIERGYGL